MIDQDFFNDVFSLYLSGVAEMHNDKEVKHSFCGVYITIEFPTQSPNKAIIRRYWGKSKMLYEHQYLNGLLHGNQIGYRYGGQIEYECQYQNGLLHGKEIRYRSNGQVWCEEQYQNGRLVE